MGKNNNNDKNGSPEYQIGYGRPPQHTRFQPGRSGNPAGRPRKMLTLEETAHKEGRATVTVLEGGKRHRLPKLTAVMRQLFNKAAAGDTRAASTLFKLLRSSQPSSSDPLAKLISEMRASHIRQTSEAPSGEDVAGQRDED